MKKVLLVLFLLITSNSSFAAGPSKVAKANRSLWSYEINTVEGFDKASQYEILAFIKVFNELEHKLKTEDDYKKYIGRDNVNLKSIESYKNKIKILFSGKYSKFYLNDHPDFASIMPAKVIGADYFWDLGVSDIEDKLGNLSEELKPWLDNAEAFYQTYIYEQIRLAALFPNITSEIDVFDSSEIKGDNLPDKTFILTFDDGPSQKNGKTDALIKTLKENNKKAIFFVLGDNFVKRNDVEDLYKGFVVGSHGKEHKAHTKPEFYEQSLTFTKQKIDDVFPNQQHCYFRPPYGQRTPQTVTFLAKHNCQVMLWNIDSQDWSSKMSSKEVKDRIITLMLLWRSGIILFHDIHSKANEILPEIWKELENSGIIFTDKVN